MLSKWTTQSDNKADSFKPKIYQGKGTDQGIPNYYDRGRQQDRYWQNSGYRSSKSPYRIDWSMDKFIEEETSGEETLEEDIIFRGRNRKFWEQQQAC